MAPDPLFDFAPPDDYRPTPPRGGPLAFSSPEPPGPSPLAFNDAPPAPTLPFESTNDDQGPCKCPPGGDDGGGKEKKKKKRKERDVCRQGTYTQRKKGIKYAPRRVVPCEGEIQPERKSSKPKTRRLPPGQLPL